MQQTFYIDGDEEISSVIERLRKSLAGENFFVLPKRALVMQSVVNLKLLKREADKMKKRVTIVTQDELSANMAVRAGIMVRSSLEGLEPAAKVEQRQDPASELFLGSDEATGGLDNFRKKARLTAVGSDSFYDSEGAIQAAEVPNDTIAVTHKPAGDTAAKKIPIRKESSRVNNSTIGNKGAVATAGLNTGRYVGKLDPQKERSLEKMFRNPKESEIVQLEVPIKGRAKKVIAGFILLCALAFAGIAAYLFVPKADITVTLFAQKKKADVDVVGSADQTGVDLESKRIPISIMHEQQQISFAYAATGESDATGTKARGTIVIYNEYSSQPQILVATTRFESADGKIFRLVKDVTVPGAAQVGGEVKPGVVEVEVAADEPGSEYNLAATTFSIPGFKGSTKFEKFSAKSTDPMTGGGSSGDMVKAVTQRDIENAKKETEVKLKEKLLEILASKLGQNEVLLDETVQFTVVESAADAKVGSIGDSFEYRAKGDMSAIIFSSSDTKQLLGEAYKQESGTSVAGIESMHIDYAGVTPDFDKKTLTMKLHGEVALKSTLDAQQVRNEFLGKDEDEIEQIVRKNPQIKNITFEFVPKFVSRVPQYPRQVEVEIKVE